jgi:hypothetical protein
MLWLVTQVLQIAAVENTVYKIKVFVGCNK